MPVTAGIESDEVDRGAAEGVVEARLVDTAVPRFTDSEIDDLVDGALDAFGTPLVVVSRTASEGGFGVGSIGGSLFYEGESDAADAPSGVRGTVARMRSNSELARTGCMEILAFTALAVVVFASPAAAQVSSSTTVDASPSTASPGQLVELDATVTCAGDPSGGLGVTSFEVANRLATIPVGADGTARFTIASPRLALTR